MAGTDGLGPVSNEAGTFKPKDDRERPEPAKSMACPSSSSLTARQPRMPTFEEPTSIEMTLMSLTLFATLETLNVFGESAIEPVAPQRFFPDVSLS